MFLYLVRHGQSVGNVRRTFHGQTDYPLTQEGRRQAQQAAENAKAQTDAAREARQKAATEKALESRYKKSSGRVW